MESTYRKRTPKDYSMSLKLQIVQDIESGQLSQLAAQRKYGIQGRVTVSNWLKKYGNFDWENKTSSPITKTPEQRIMELEAELALQKSKWNLKTRVWDR